MSLHPLIELSNDAQVKQAKGFRAAAAELSGEKLEILYQGEAANAPRREEAGKKYLGVRTGRIPTGLQAGKDDRHLAMAVAAFTQATDAAIELPSGDKLTIIDALVPLRTAAPDKAKGDADPNKGVEDIDLLGLLPDDRLAVIRTKFLAPEATRGGAGDTPLRALLTGLAQTAIVDANAAVLRAEIQEATSRTTSEEAPALIILASPRYWEICRKREAQKGAGWIRELERLGREVSGQIGVEIFYLSIQLESEPGWAYEEGGPVLMAAPDLGASWEPGAGKLKPKPKARARKADAAPAIVEADLSKPPRSYRISDTYEPGERIEHAKLGTGVVQQITGRQKISVLFGEETKLLAHERPVAGV
ncbi:MAG: hypothetical protein JRG92_13390 [Deltaproteobacteria bacterium]|nr:hypothetical protein [Deltaproteobacteria bacterium]MBW2384627.1 hypothetical protein [Deltaproteobacteria bacterium]